MSIILNTARALMTILSPLTGTVGTGNLTVQSTTGSGSVVLPQNSYGIPVTTSAGGNSKLEPHVLLKTTEETTVDEDGAAVPVKTVLSNTAGNIAAGTVIRWSPRITDIEATSVVAAGGITGAVPDTGFGTVKQIRFYEQVGTAQAGADLFRGKVGLFPALVLLWTGSDGDDRKGRGRQPLKERWILAVVSSRLDNDDERRSEGLAIMEEATRLIIDRSESDGYVFSSPDSLFVRKRGRLVSTETSYIYTIEFTTQIVECRVDDRTFQPWVTFRQDEDTRSGEEPEVSVVDNAQTTMP
jgi:hypothetical protein